MPRMGRSRPGQALGHVWSDGSIFMSRGPVGHRPVIGSMTFGRIASRRLGDLHGNSTMNLARMSRAGRARVGCRPISRQVTGSVVVVTDLSHLCLMAEVTVNTLPCDSLGHSKTGVA